jgi:hypothetical protein
MHLIGCFPAIVCIIQFGSLEIRLSISQCSFLWHCRRSSGLLTAAQKNALGRVSCRILTPLRATYKYVCVCSRALCSFVMCCTHVPTIDIIIYGSDCSVNYSMNWCSDYNEYIIIINGALRFYSSFLSLCLYRPYSDIGSYNVKPYIFK